MDDVTALMTVINVPTCRSITLAFLVSLNPADVGGLVHFLKLLHLSTISSTTYVPTCSTHFFWLPLSGLASKQKNQSGDDAFKNIISVVIFSFVCSVGLIMLDAT